METICNKKIKLKAKMSGGHRGRIMVVAGEPATGIQEGLIWIFDKLYIKEIAWLDLEEDTDFIVQEIQSLLLAGFLDEFACEVISFCWKREV